MSRKGGWRREGRRGAFRYVDVRGDRITDEDQLARIQSLVIPPAWQDVWISPSATAKVQATGLDAAGRRQYIYHPDFRARREQEKYDKLISFAERLPDLRHAMSEHMDRDGLDRERVSAVATRLINRAWFRVGSERYAKQSKTYGITTLTKRHVNVRGHRIGFQFRTKHKVVVRTTLVDAEISDALKELLALPGGRRLFRYDFLAPAGKRGPEGLHLRLPAAPDLRYTLSAADGRVYARLGTQALAPPARPGAVTPASSIRCLISGTARAASGMFTVTRTISEPASASSMHC